MKQSSPDRARVVQDPRREDPLVYYLPHPAAWGSDPIGFAEGERRLVRKRGFEPRRPCGHKLLSPVNMVNTIERTRTGLNGR